MTIDTSYTDRPLSWFAVSGGRDSIAAAHWLRFRFRKDFKIVHVNHGTRKSYNSYCEDGLRAFAKELDVTLHIYRTRAEVPTEDGWRKARLEAFGNVVDENAVIFTAHHLNDAVESYLMNTFRGHPERMPIPKVSHFDGFWISHPFAYTVTRQELSDYAVDNDLFRFIATDPSNADDGPLRNFVRKRILPPLNQREDLSLTSVVRRKWGQL